MKKILLAALFAGASISGFGATCASMSGLTMQDLNTAGGCTIDSWSLGLWEFGLGGSSQTGYAGGNPALSDIAVSFQTGLTNGAGAAGFSVTFSDAAGLGSLSNYFTAQALGPITQSVNFKPIYTISGGPSIAQVFLSVDAADPKDATTGDGLFGIIKFLVDPTVSPDPIIASNPINYAFGGAGSNPILIYNNQSSAIPLLGVVDSYQIQSGTSGSASLTSFTNTFFVADPPTGDVPEPITFVLMGLGLVGVAALRRRNS